MEQELQNDIVSLQTQVAYQDKLINELNLLVFRQQEELDRVKLGLVQLHEKIASLSSDSIKDLSEETPPPHY